MDKISQLPLRDFTDLANNKLKEPPGHTTVNEIFGDSFKLIKRRKRLFGDTDRNLRGSILLLDDSIGVWMSGEMLSFSMTAPLNTTLTPLVGESEYVPARSLKKRIFKLVPNLDAPMSESTRRLHMDGGLSSLWCINARQRNALRLPIDSGAMQYNTLQNILNYTYFHFSSPSMSPQTTLCLWRMVQGGRRDLNVPNCAGAPGTHYFFGHPTQQI